MGIAENNFFLLLASLGLAAPHFGTRLLPVGTVYDPFIARGLDALKRHLWARRDKGWVDLRSKREVGAVSIVADVDCGRITITGRAFGQPIDQKLEVVAQPLPYGGERYFVLCPLSGKRCTVLLIPPGKTFFASARGWGVPYASTRECEVQRAYRAMRKVEETRLSKYARRPTRERCQQRWMRAFDIASQWEERLMG